MNVARVLAIVGQLWGKDPAMIARLPADLAQAAKDGLSAAVLAEVAPGLALTETAELQAAVDFLSLPIAIPVAQLGADFALLAGLEKAVPAQ